MKFGSLFSGIGGLDLGLERAGHSIEFQCEVDPFRRSVLSKHWPDVPVHEDVKATRIQGEIDALCGGFPCQDLSVAGKRAGLKGEQSGLFFDFLRHADDHIETGGWILVENVPGLLSSNEGRDFAVILTSLAKFGFNDCAWRVLDSRYFGVPQRRRRLFILARRTYRSGLCAGTVLLEPECGGGNFEESKKQKQKHTKGTQERFGEISHCITADARQRLDHNDYYHIEDVKNATLTSSTGRIDRHPMFVEVMGFSENQRAEVLETEYAHQLTTGGGKPGQGYAAVRIDKAVRRLTPTECERLQGFPDGWTITEYNPRGKDKPKEGIDPQPDGRRYAAIGDAVTVNVAEWIGKRLYNIER